MSGQFQYGEISPWRYFIFIGFFIACLFTRISNENSLPIWLNFLKWQVQIFSAILFFVIVHTWLKGPLAKLGNISKLVLSALIAATLFTPFSLLADVYIEKETQYTLTALIQEWLDMVPTAVFTWVAINLPWQLGFKIQKVGNLDESISKQTLSVKQAKKTATLSEHDHNAKSVSPEDVLLSDQITHFLKLCGINDVSEIIVLKAELHYLKVVTHNQEKLVLYNLKDAIDIIESTQIDLAQGQTHRSYWVNRQYIKQLKRNGREGVLVMTNNAEALISRTYMNKVRSWDV